MKLINTILPLAALSSAFILPNEQMAEKAFLPSKPKSLSNKLHDTWSSIEDTVKHPVIVYQNAFDSAIRETSNFKAKIECHASMMKWDIQQWLQSETPASSIDAFEMLDHPHRHPKHPHHGHSPHRKPNLTVYQIIAGSKYTTKLAKLIDEFPELVKTLNGTDANYTVFAPTDAAFAKLPHHGEKPPKELIEKVLKYHVSPEFYPAGRVLVTHTIPTALEPESLGGDPQRLRVGLGLRGLAVNFYSRIIAIDIFGTNGVIHGVDSLLLPPPPAFKIIELLPTEFSTLQLGLLKTGILAIDTDPHTGGTIFAPSNDAFKKLGPRINAFLFSKYGEKYLKALLQYHIVANQTLYSDAFYKAKDVDSEAGDELVIDGGIPKGRFHLDLPTLLEEKSLSIDIARWGGFITILINGFNSVAVQDGIAKDGVIHVVSSVLIPPKTPGGSAWAGEELTLEDFKSRFALEDIPEL